MANGHKNGRPASIDAAPILTRWHTRVHESTDARHSGVILPAGMVREFDINTSGAWRASLRQVRSRRSIKLVIVLEPL